MQNYKFVERIGTGTYGSAFKCLDRTTKEEVCWARVSVVVLFHCADVFAVFLLAYAPLRVVQQVVMKKLPIDKLTGDLPPKLLTKIYALNPGPLDVRSYNFFAVPEQGSEPASLAIVFPAITYQVGQVGNTPQPPSIVTARCVLFARNVHTGRCVVCAGPAKSGHVVAVMEPFDFGRILTCLVTL